MGSLPMSKVSEFRNHAEECRALAQRTKSADDRAMLLNMAATWDSLADAREKKMAKENPPVEE
jgi:hypothetical protein